MRGTNAPRQGRERTMSNIPKNSSPTYYWFNAIRELQALVAPTDPRWQQYENLLTGAIDLRCLSVPSFCQHEPPPQVVPEIEDFISGAWIEVLQNTALASVYYNLCQESDDVMLQSTTVLTSAQIATLATIPVQLLPSPGLGVGAQLLAVAVRRTVNGVSFTVVGDLLVWRNNVGDPDVTIPGAVLSNPDVTYEYEAAPSQAGGLFNYQNMPIMLQGNGTNDSGGGNDTLTVDVYYVLVGP
jgi:hypothetical protein